MAIISKCVNWDVLNITAICSNSKPKIINLDLGLKQFNSEFILVSILASGFSSVFKICLLYCLISLFWATDLIGFYLFCDWLQPQCVIPGDVPPEDILF